MTIFTCNDTFSSIMTCIYQAWDSGLGHKNIRLEVVHDSDLELFCEYRHIDEDFQKTQKVVRAIRQKISHQAYGFVYQAAMSASFQKADIIYRFLLLGFSYGSSVLQQLQNPYIMNFFNLYRKVSNEAHYFREFLRFDRISSGIFLAKIAPRSHVVTLLGDPFSDRMPSENWIILDERRLEAVIHPADRDYYLTVITQEEYRELLAFMHHPDPYADLWKSFFHAISIEKRKNLRCQQTVLPLWYRKNMTEFI